MKIKNKEEIKENIIEVAFDEELTESFGEYTMEVLKERAIPNIEDGNKPSALTALYAMYDMKIMPNGPTVKSARVVGEIIGKYHPHGDSSAYGVIVNMTQPFSTNIPYITPNGNFGSVSGDKAASMRYCHTGDTVVNVSRIGDITVEEFIKKYDLEKRNKDGYMNISDLKIKLLNYKGNYVPTDCLIDSGMHPTIKITVKRFMNNSEERFELEGTFNHPILCIYKGTTTDPEVKWVTLEELYNMSCNDKELPCVMLCFKLNDCSNKYIDLGEIVKFETSGSNKKRVYSFRVNTEMHSYVTNNFVSHNTECKLSWYSKDIIMKDLSPDVVEYQPNYDDSLEYAKYMPAILPDILINGSYGIAVGYTTSILPHNLGDVINLCIAYVKDRSMTPEDMYKIIQGPDFPLPCIINGTDGLQRIYTSGNGYCRVRGLHEVEVDKKGNTRFVITSVPYRTLTSTICTDIGLLYDKGEIDIKDIRDESSQKTGIRICLDLGKNESVDRVLSLLVSRTGFEKVLNVDHNVLVNGTFKKSANIKTIMEEFVKFREKCLHNKFMAELKNKQDRLHILEGLFIVNQDIDKAIKIIKNADNTNDAKEKLMKHFKLSEVQAVYILDLKLARLTKLNMGDAKEEEKSLKERVKVLLKLTRSTSNSDVDKYMIEEWEAIREIKEAKPYLTRTAKIQKRLDKITVEDTIPDDPCTIIFTKKGYIKRVDSLGKEQKRGGKGSSVGTLQDDDEIKQVINTTLKSELMFLTNTGRVYNIFAHGIQPVSKVARGVLARNILGMRDNETIVLTFINEKIEGTLISCTRRGIVKSTNLKALSKINASGKNLIGIAPKDFIIDVVVIPEEDKNKDVIIATRDGLCMRMDSSEIRPSGTGAIGVIGITLKPGDEVVSMTRALPKVPIVFVTQKGYIKRVKSEEFATQKRGGMGVKCTDTKNGAKIVAMVAKGDESILLYTRQGKSLTCDLSTIKMLGRTAIGVKGITLAPDDTVIGVG